jgi:hypothetical protein
VISGILPTPETKSGNRIAALVYSVVGHLWDGRLRHDVKLSSVVEKPAGILYNSATGLMVMEFADHVRYIYHDVPQGVYAALKYAAAREHTRFVNEAGGNYSIIEGIAY